MNYLKLCYDQCSIVYGLCFASTMKYVIMLIQCFPLMIPVYFQFVIYLFCWTFSIWYVVIFEIFMVIRNNIYLFKKNGTLYFSNTIKTIDHIDLILSGIHIHPWPCVSCKFGKDIQRNKVKATILVKEAKTV